MVGPGIKSGSVNNTPVNLIDLFPTFMDIADAEPTDDLDLDGCNIYPLMKGEESNARFADGSVRDTIYFTLPVGGASASAIRKNGWKLIHNGHGDAGSGHQQFIRYGINIPAQLGLLPENPGEKTVKGISECGNDKGYEGKIRLAFYQEDNQQRD